MWSFVTISMNIFNTIVNINKLTRATAPNITFTPTGCQPK